MTSLPETRYAKSGDLSIAYQVMGDGPLDLILVPSTSHHVEFIHEIPGYTQFVEVLASFARVMTFDKRGSGLSDPVAGAPSLEERMDDVRAVMDAVGSERAVLFGWAEGGAMSMLFAATYPQRTTALVLYTSFARVLWSDDYADGWQAELIERLTDALVESWGEPKTVNDFVPSMVVNPELASLWAKFERLCISPGALRALVQLNAKVDVRSVLPLIRVPTLVLHARSGFFPVAWGRYLADRIPGARFVELDGGDLWPFFDNADSTLAEVEEFLTGRHQAVRAADRMLATVLFTDIVRSTEHASEMGDGRWRRLLDSHDALIARQLKRFQGCLIKSTGDGVLATFDGPGRALNCATAIRDGLRALGLEICAGLHTGELELRGDDIGGIAVHIAARVLEKAQPGEVLVSRTLTDLVAGSGLRFEERGEHALKGVSEKWQLFAATA